MKKYRNLRIAERINQELSILFVRDFDFGGAMVTITDVIVGEDLLHAIIKLGIIPEEQGPEIFFSLEKSKRDIQRKLNRILNIKPMPHISFQIDRDGLGK